MLSAVKIFTLVARKQLLKPSFVCQPRYFLLQNTGRLKSKPKILETPVPFIEKEDFQSEANLFLFRIEKSFEELKEFETKINLIERVNENDGEDYKLSVNIADVGTFLFYTDFNQRLLYFNSPISGLFKYYYDKNTEMWKSNKDEHFLIEHLTRETSKYCQAYLKL